MKKIVVRYFGSFLFLCASVAGCTKYTDPPYTGSPQSDCLIETVSMHESGLTISYAYDSAGRLRTLSTNNLVQDYLYAGDSNYMKDVEAGVFVRKTIVHRNHYGLADYVRVEKSPDGRDWLSTTYQYQGEQVLSSTSRSSASPFTTVTNYRWQNGNLISIINGQDTLSLTYFTNQAARLGDYFSFFQLNQGYEIYRVRNLAKSIGLSDYAYSFYSDGKISAISMGAPGNVSRLNLTYHCK